VYVFTNTDIKEDIERIVTSNGGKYEKSLELQTCTHLVVAVEEGEKYLTAINWNSAMKEGMLPIAIVNYEWVLKCRDSGCKRSFPSYLSILDNTTQ
jgi:hypothetical protein